MGCTSGVMHDYGATEAIAMEASSGNALTAKVNGRPISLIHGGALSPEGTLRPSQGVRLSEVNMLSLDLAMATFGEPAQVIIGEGLK